MKKTVVAVTGASGHVGAALINTLKDRDEFYIKALALTKSDAEFLQERADEVIEGDVTDHESLEKCFSDADIVYHLAGIITIGREDRKLLKKVNVEGTRNVVEACIRCGVKRLVYTSSVHAIDFADKKEVLREKDRYNPKKVVGSYAKTKAEAANIVLDANGSLLETVVCMPSGVTGPYGYKRSNIGQLIVDYVSGKLTAYCTGRYNYVDSRDVANALIAAAEKGRAGESYIISGEICSLDDMLGAIGKAAKLKRPVRLNMGFLKAVAPLAELYYRARKVKPLFTPYSLYTLTSNCNFDNAKARQELGFAPRSIRQSILDEYEFMRAVDPDAFLTKKQMKALKKERRCLKKLKTVKANKNH